MYIQEAYDINPALAASQAARAAASRQSPESRRREGVRAAETSSRRELKAAPPVRGFQ